MNNYLSVVTGALDGAVKRGELISNNIANISTPNYKRQDINFKSMLSREIESNQDRKVAMETTNSKHIPFSKNYTNINTSLSQNSRSYRNDQNNVDIDFEMAELAKNSIYYNVMTRRAAGHFSTLNKVISQGGK